MLNFPSEPFVRYIVKGPGAFNWWDGLAEELQIDIESNEELNSA